MLLIYFSYAKLLLMTELKESVLDILRYEIKHKNI